MRGQFAHSCLEQLVKNNKIYSVTSMPNARGASREMRRAARITLNIRIQIQKQMHFFPKRIQLRRRKAENLNSCNSIWTSR